MLKIGLIQIRCEKGAIGANLATTSHYVAEAAARGVDILAFPETSLTGYAQPDTYPQAILSLDGPQVARVLEITRGKSTTVLAGLIEENPQGRPYITQIVVRDGQLLGSYRKMSIDEEEPEPEDWYALADTVPVFSHRDLVFGIAICADIGNAQVFAACARQGAKVVFELAAPGLYGEQATRDWRSGFEWWEGECEKYLSHYARQQGIWVAVATQAGRTIDEDFPGGGYIFAPSGQRLYATPDGPPGAVYLALDFERHQVTTL